MLQITDDNRVRTLTLNRPDVLNAFNEELYHATAVALRDAATDPEVAVVLLTGAGRAFSAGNDLNEMQRRITDPTFNDQGSHFSTMIDALTDLPKPLICAVNGVGVGIGATVLGYADLVFMSSTARLKTPVHQPGRRARGGVLVSAPAVDGPAECGVAVDVVGVGRRGRGAADGTGVEGV